jgi:hypothetical protein
LSEHVTATPVSASDSNAASAASAGSAATGSAAARIELQAPESSIHPGISWKAPGGAPSRLHRAKTLLVRTISS